MQLEAQLLITTPCDDEEDDMALLCCHGLAGELFLMTRFPEDDDIEITYGDNDPVLLSDIKVTLSADQLQIEVAAVDGGLFNGDDILVIEHSTDAADLPEVLETLNNILKGTGTLLTGA